MHFKPLSKSFKKPYLQSVNLFNLGPQKFLVDKSKKFNKRKSQVKSPQPYNNKKDKELMKVMRIYFLNIENWL